MRADMDDPAIRGFEQIYTAAFKAARYDEHRRGLFPPDRAAEDLGTDAVIVTWLGIQLSEDLVRAINGERDPLNRAETRYWVDLALRQLNDEIDDPETVLDGDWARALIGKAFVSSNRETPLYRALGAFVKGSISRLIFHYRKRPKVKDGTTYDGKRRRRLLRPAEHLGDNAETLVSRDRGSSTDATIDGRMVLAHMTDLERAICSSYFIDEETLQELSSRPWLEDGHISYKSLHEIRKIRDKAVQQIEHVLGADYK